MVNESINNPQDPTYERFARMEAQVTNINCNGSFLMGGLTNKLGIFEEDGGSTVDIRLKGKLLDWEELERESKKELEKDQPSSSVMKHSQSLLKIEAKVNIKPY